MRRLECLFDAVDGKPPCCFDRSGFYSKSWRAPIVAA
jgi:hypothetical protein